MSTGISTAKMILFGEHAVVYGEPAISVPFTQALIKTEVSPSAENQFASTFFTGPIEEMPPFLDGIKRLILSIQKLLEQPEPVTVKVLSDVPVGRGLGSSAAVATSVTRGLYNYYEKKLTEEMLLKLVNQAEDVAHGNASGLDAVTVVTERPVWYAKGKNMETIHFAGELIFVVADTGIPSETKAAVADVGVLCKKEPLQYMPLIKELGGISWEMKGILETSIDKIRIGEAMNRSQSILKKLTVSDPKLENLIQVALSAGAYGAKLTGGGRGGCMFAIVENREIAEKVVKALQANGSAKEWIFTIGEGKHEGDRSSTYECGIN